MDFFFGPRRKETTERRFKLMISCGKSEQRGRKGEPTEEKMKNIWDSKIAKSWTNSELRTPTWGLNWPKTIDDDNDETRIDDSDDDDDDEDNDENDDPDVKAATSTMKRTLSTTEERPTVVTAVRIVIAIPSTSS